MANETTTEACVMTGQVDWAKLREQKQHLIEVIGDREASCATENQKMQNQSLQGILNLIDHIQDDAATTLGEEVVFCDYPIATAIIEWIESHVREED